MKPSRLIAAAAIAASLGACQTIQQLPTERLGLWRGLEPKRDLRVPCAGTLHERLD